MTDQDSIKAGAVIVGGLVAVVLLIAVMVFATMGLGTPVGESTYTGQIVNAQSDKGMVFKVDTVTARTGDDASVDEEFCVLEESLLEDSKRFVGTGERVEIAYERPLWLSPTDCESGSVIMSDVSPAE